MKNRVICILIILSFLAFDSFSQTSVTIKGDQFLINGKLTYQGRYWNGNKIEGLLLNSRMVQGIFDDRNPETAKNWVYPDTKKWDPGRNTNEFVANMKSWRDNGLLSFTINLQGGSPFGYSPVQTWINSAYNEDGSLVLGQKTIKFQIAILSSCF